MSQNVKTKKSQKSKQNEEQALGFERLEDVDHPLTMVLYGRPGTGKTTLAGTFPKPMLYIDIRDKGTKSIKGIPGITVKRLEEAEELDDILRFLRRNRGKYKSVVLDTVSQLQQMIVEEVADGKKLKGRNPGDWGTMSQQDWGKVSSRMKRLIIDYRDLADDGTCVLFLAQEKLTELEVEEQAGKGYVLAPEIGPSLSRSAADVLNGSVSVIASTFVRVRTIEKISKEKKKTKETKIEFCLRLAPDPVYIGKVRKDKSIEVPKYVVNPSYSDLISIINGE